MSGPSRVDQTRPALPWATVTLGLLAALAWFSPRLNDLFFYERAGIFRGEIWRGWTGHVAHFGSGHLFWNLAVFVPAGCWLERLWPVQARWFLAAAPLLISLLLLGFDPSLLRYAGLSGVGTGVLVLLAGLQLRRKADDPAWFWLGVLGLVGVKIAYEAFTGETLLVTGAGFAGVRNVPLAHIGGVLCAALFWVVSVARSGAKRDLPVAGSG